jgi:DNA-binding LacI/PurR family transcriptional regulator
MKSPTLKDIADSTGVSLATVSLALSGKGRISPSVRENILITAETLGYRRKKQHDVVTESSAPVGLFLSVDAVWGLAWWLIRPIVEEIESGLRSRGSTLVAIPISMEMDDATILAKAEESRCSGFFSLHFARESLFSRLEERGQPVVLIMNGSFQDRFSSILVDDFQGAYEGSLHLIKLGHRDMLYIDMDRPGLGLPVLSTDRFVGFRKALEENGIELQPGRYVRFIMDDIGYLETLVRSVFSAEPRPTAVFAMDDDVAIRVVSILHGLGLRVPEDVSIIAPGDMLKYGDPHIVPITTMRINTQLMGKIAVDMMVGRLADPAGEFHVIKIKQQLVQRGSTMSLARRSIPIGARTAELTGRERVLSAFERKRQRFVARWIGLSPEFLARAVRELGLDEEELHRRLGDDFRRVEAGWAGPTPTAPVGSKCVDPFGVARYGAGYGQARAHPLKGRFTEEDLHVYLWPNPEWIDVSTLRERILGYRGEYAVVGGDPSPFWHDAIDLVGMEDLACLMYDEPDFVSALFAKIMDYYIGVSTRIFEEAGDLIDIFYIRGNFGSQTGPLVGSEHFTRFLVPCLRRLTELGHRYGVKVMLHSSGSFRPLIPSIIEAGVDALHSLQPDCAGMGGPGIKRDFGSALVLAGAIDARKLILPGPPASVRAGTIAVLSAMAPGSGYIAGPSTEAVLEDTPVAHLLAMCDAIDEWSESKRARG